MTKFSTLLVLLTLISIVIPIVIMVVIRLAKPGFIYHWLIASLGSFLAWLLVLFVAYEPPFSIPLGIWQPKLLVSASPIFQIDQISWSFAVAIVALAVGVIFTDVSRPDGTSWFSWTSILVLSVVGLLAVFAGNPLTLLMSWMLLDLAHFVILLKENSENDLGNYLPIDLAFRFLGTVILMVAGFFSVQSNSLLSFSYNNPIVISLLILSVFFRIGSFPYHSPVLANPQSRRSLGTTTRLISVASAVVLLPRIATGIKASGVHISNESAVLFIIGCLALLAGVAWMIAKDEMDGRSYWILGIALLAIASALRAEPEAALAWGLAGILTGGLLFAASFRDKRIIWLPLFGVLMMSALPFSPTWNVASLFNPPLTISHILYFITFVFLLSGYIKHGRNMTGSMTGLERWVWLIYPFGLIAIIISNLWLGWQIKPALENVSILEWLIGVIGLTMSIALLFAFKWLSQIPPAISSKFNIIFSLEWIYRFFHNIYVFVQALINFITHVLEGEGGILWTLLWVAVILAILGIRLGG